MDIIEIIYSIPMKLAGLAQALGEFIFAEITIGTVTVSLWGLLGGIGIAVAIIASILGQLN